TSGSSSGQPRHTSSGVLPTSSISSSSPSTRGSPAIGSPPHGGGVSPGGGVGPPGVAGRRSASRALTSSTVLARTSSGRSFLVLNMATDSPVTVLRSPDSLTQPSVAGGQRAG